MQVSPADRSVLRRLARRTAEIARGEENQRRIARWKRHNSLQPGRPLLLIFPEGSWGELLPPSALECEDPELRNTVEFHLRHQIYAFEHFRSDNVVDAELQVPKAISDSGWGLEARWIPSTAPGGARTFDPVLLQPSDLKQLRYPQVMHDEAASRARLERMQDLLGDILPVRLRGIAHVSFHLMALYTAWRGLQETLMDMLVEPNMLHDAMAFLEEGHRRLIRQYEEMNLLERNNDNTYHSSGGNGWTDELPPAGSDPAQVRPRDMWASAEAQEMAVASPGQHAEFSLQYERRLLEPFALAGYGCCEDLTRKLADVLAIPNIRRISVSPWSDVEACAGQIRRRAIFSWKPQPAHLVGRFDPEAIRAYVARTLEAARDCVLEIILKDTHTCENRPERFDQWSGICRELVGND